MGPGSGLVAGLSWVLLRLLCSFLSVLRRQALLLPVSRLLVVSGETMAVTARDAWVWRETNREDTEERRGPAFFKQSPL